MVKQHSKQTSGTAPPAAKKAAKDPVAEQIGAKLRAMFDDALTEPVPEKFRQLLEELERKSSKD